MVKETPTAHKRTAPESAEMLQWTEELELNLSDFALFLSVMKSKSAHEAVLSIIMDENELQLNEV